MSFRRYALLKNSHWRNQPSGSSERNELQRGFPHPFCFTLFFFYRVRYKLASRRFATFVEMKIIARVTKPRKILRSIGNHYVENIREVLQIGIARKCTSPFLPNFQWKIYEQQQQQQWSFTIRPRQGKTKRRARMVFGHILSLLPRTPGSGAPLEWTAGKHDCLGNIRDYRQKK